MWWVFFSRKLDYEFKHQNNCVSICCDLKTKTYLPGESLYTEFIFTISVQGIRLQPAQPETWTRKMSQKALKRVKQL